MSVGNSLILTKSNKKQVLQQSNSNFDIVSNNNNNEDRIDNFKVVTKTKEDGGYEETENQLFGPVLKILDKNHGDVKKLKNIRIDLSSPKRRCGKTIVKPSHRSDGKSQKDSFVSSDESSGGGGGEEEEYNNKKRKKIRPVVPNYVTNSDEGPCRKPRQCRQDPAMISSHQNSSSKLGKTQPLSIARRNARERNRVKQVNEGFATLRNRIPEYISEAYNEEKGRKSAKKLSKVETLRMAVDYIRHLETLLDIRSSSSTTTETENYWMMKDSEGSSSQPWEGSNSPIHEYPESLNQSKYQPPLPPSSPSHIYDQNGFEYQDRVFYDYDLDFLNKKENTIVEKRSPLFNVLTTLNDTENQSCVDDFKYYESFDNLKKENDPHDNDENENDNDDVDGEKLNENLQQQQQFLDKQPETCVKSNDVIKKMTKKTVVLPSITETFNKGVTAVFF